MNTKTAEFRVEVEGPPLSVDQLEHLLNKIKAEGERSGVEVTVKRITTEESDHEPKFE